MREHADSFVSYVNDYRQPDGALTFERGPIMAHAAWRALLELYQPGKTEVMNKTFAHLYVADADGIHAEVVGLYRHDDRVRLYLVRMERTVTEATSSGMYRLHGWARSQTPMPSDPPRRT